MEKKGRRSSFWLHSDNKKALYVSLRNEAEKLVSSVSAASLFCL